MGQSVPKHRHIKFRRRGVTQKKTYNTLIEISTKFYTTPQMVPDLSASIKYGKD
jgi:hypothetical protein